MQQMLPSKRSFTCGLLLIVSTLSHVKSAPAAVSLLFEATHVADTPQLGGFSWIGQDFTATGLSLISPGGTVQDNNALTRFDTFAEFIADITGTWMLERNGSQHTFEISPFAESLFPNTMLTGPPVGSVFQSGETFDVTYDAGGASSTSLAWFSSSEFNVSTQRTGLGSSSVSVALNPGVASAEFTFGPIGTFQIDGVVGGILGNTPPPEILHPNIEFDSIVIEGRATIVATTSIPEPSHFAALAAILLRGVLTHRRRHHQG